MAIYVIEYKNHEPIAEYTLSGVSAGLSFIEEQEGVWRGSRTHRISDRPVLKVEAGPSKMREIGMLLWVLYVTAMTVYSWFATVSTLNEFQSQSWHGLFWLSYLRYYFPQTIGSRNKFLLIVNNLFGYHLRKKRLIAN